MPIIASSTYSASGLYRYAHVSSIFPTMFRRMSDIPYIREQVNTPDGDFIDLDCLYGNSGKVVVLCHGLEGSTQGKYMRGMARHFHASGWDVAAMNFRGCSGRPNVTAQSYHSGVTKDLQVVLAHVANKGYNVAALVGFSLGGNLIMKYLGENPADVWSKIIAAVTFSVPVELGDAGKEISRSQNWMYNKRFLRRLTKKIHNKAKCFPKEIRLDSLKTIKNLADFDEAYTGPMHGFTGAEDYYSKCSSRQFLTSIRIPTLLVSASDDPFLGKKCYPKVEAEASEYFFFENPTHGGHVGFVSPGDVYWSEARALAFVQDHLSDTQF